MARTPLFAALRRALIRIDSERRGIAPAPHSGPSRRQFLGATAGVLAVPLLPACGDNGGGGEPVSVAVIGAGVAGLHCAYRLVEAEADVEVTVYEASGRTGGRMWSRGDLFGPGQVCELGGELVDSGHATVQALCEEFDLALDDLKAGADGLVEDGFFFDGRMVPAAELSAAFTPLAARMAATVTAAEADDAEFARVDAMSIPDWLEAEGLAADDLLRRCLELAYLGEYGLEVDQQSIFNLLYLIDHDDPDPFRVFGDSDERYHIHAGSQAVPDALARRLAGRIRLEHALTAIGRDGDRHRLTFATAGGELEVIADHVVLAIPFSTLRRVDLTAAELPADKLEVITALGYGTNSKLMSGYTSRPWRSAGSDGSIFTDVGELQTTWDTSRGQPGDTGILTNFVGGERGIAIGDGSAEDQMSMVLPWLAEVFPGITGAYVATSAVRQHWPSAPHHLGSYACYRPGQWAFYGTEGSRAGNVHFCGEHTSLDFQGYMEGGAETGALVALEILGDLGVPAPALLRRALASALTRPQACYQGGGRRWSRPMRRQQRRRLGGR